LIQEKRALKADEEYRIEIQAIVSRLIDEYRTALTQEASGDFKSLMDLTSANPAEEQDVSFSCIFNLKNFLRNFLYRKRKSSCFI
jgi:hypothetical protein